MTKTLLLLGLGAALCAGCVHSHGTLQTEDGGTPSGATPDANALDIDFIDVATAFQRTCAVSSEGDVYCWGIDVGDVHDSTDDVTRTSPVRVEGVANAVRVKITEYTACALLADHHVTCWGETAPAILVGSEDTTELALTTERVCTLRNDGTIRCWGNMQAGSCGGSPEEVSAFELPGVTDATSVALDDEATCFTREGGKPACYINWGGESAVLREIDFPFTDVRALSVGFASACSFESTSSYCAVRQDGSVLCVFDNAGDEPSVRVVHDGGPAASELVWYGRANGEPWFGVPTSADYCVHTQVGALICSNGWSAQATAASFSRSHACFIENGALFCWGSNFGGALGIGEPTSRLHASRIPELQNVTAIAAGATHTCALRANGEVICWGANVAGERGWSDPVISPDDATLPLSGRRYTRYDESFAPQTVAGLAPATGVFANQWRTCIVDGSQTLTCWGEALRITQTTNLSMGVPTQIESGRGANFASAGDNDEMCAIIDGDVRCWGQGYFGSRIGVEQRPLPSNAIDVDAQTGGGCAVLDNGQVHCWGRQAPGTPNAATEPLRIEGVENAGHVSDKCAVTSAHELFCWADRATAALVASDVVDVDGRCYVRTNGTVACRAPDGDTSSSFIDVPGITDAARVQVGDSHACALTQDGHVACWGDYASGKLGDGTRVEYPTPQRVVVR